jgi:general secretion pathway protein G
MLTVARVITDCVAPREALSGSPAAQAASARCLRSRRWQHGLTLVELIVVITLVGLLAAAIAVGVMKTFNDGRVKTAAIACDHLRTAAQAHFVNSPEESDCPTPAKMQEARELDAAMSLRDPWGMPYSIECQSDEVIAISAGPDRAFGTEDDIRVPGPRRAATVATTRH